MSLSNPTKANNNPAQLFIEWKGAKGVWSYYDKEAQQSVEMPPKFYIVILDELATIRGYDKMHDCGIYSNEVHNTYKEELKVKSFEGGPIATGKYADIKHQLPKGAKFTRSVYAALLTPDKAQPIGFSAKIVNLQINGSALGPWIDSKFQPDGEIVEVGANTTAQKKGQTTYYVPTFAKLNKTPKRAEAVKAVKDVCVELDRKLQSYLTDYKDEAQALSNAPDNIGEGPTYIDGLPF